MRAGIKTLQRSRPARRRRPGRDRHRSGRLVGRHRSSRGRHLGRSEPDPVLAAAGRPSRRREQRLRLPLVLEAHTPGPVAAAWQSGPTGQEAKSVDQLTQSPTESAQRKFFRVADNIPGGDLVLDGARLYRRLGRSEAREPGPLGALRRAVATNDHSLRPVSPAHPTEQQALR